MVRRAVDGTESAGRWAVRAYENGLDCFADTYSTLLTNLSVDPRVLGDYWGYDYGPPLPDFEPSFMRIRASHYEYGHSIRRWYGISERCISHGSSEALWDHVRLVLGNGRQVVVQVNTFAYPRSPFYQAVHYLHRIVITGIEAGAAYVVDDLPVRSFRGWLAVAELDHAIALAGATEHLGAAAKPFFTIDLPGPIAFSSPSADTLRDALVGNTRRYLVGSDAVDQPVGHHAAKRFVADVRRYAETARVVDDRVLLRGVSFLSVLTRQRRQNAQFLGLAGDALRVDLSEAATQLRQLSDRLDGLRAAFFFGASAKRPIKEHLSHVADEMAGMFGDEYECMRRLSSLVPG
ncbi:BtrH N-terminal domain-containing protein [Kribbella sp. NBC_01505]|uniref:BtrH N-terminal domain-containing protein n=1 Tax=Kribbella sp. NBC_01505 TaxID=2903580 RepID=UPI0038691784